VEQIAREHARHRVPSITGAAYNIHAYICGLNEMVSARDCLKALGWERKQIIFERYD
jgi:hypothetical protein